MSNAEPFDHTRKRALDILARSGISRANYLPPLYPLLWRIGLRLRPPHYAQFWVNLLVAGVPMGAMSIGLYMAAHSYETASLNDMLVIGAAVSAAWGGAIASYFQASKKRHRIPDWESLAARATA